MPHAQSAVLKNHQRIARLSKRAQPMKMEEVLDGDRLLQMLERDIREGELAKAAARIEIAEGVELLFSSPAKRTRFAYLRERESRRLKRRKGAAA